MKRLTADRPAIKTNSNAQMLTSVFLRKCSVMVITIANPEMMKRTAMELATTGPNGVLHLRLASLNGNIAMESVIVKTDRTKLIVIARAARPPETSCARIQKETTLVSASPKNKSVMEFLIALVVSMKKAAQELASLIRPRYLTMKLKLFAQMAERTTRNMLAPGLLKLAKTPALNAIPNRLSLVETVVVSQEDLCVMEESIVKMEVMKPTVLVGTILSNANQRPLLDSPSASIIRESVTDTMTVLEEKMKQTAMTARTTQAALTVLSTVVVF